MKTITNKINKRVKRLFLDIPENLKSNKLSKAYNICGEYKRIYLYHIRKTGGTSLNNIFLSLNGNNGSELYAKLSTTPTHRVIANNNVFVGYRKNIIQQGNYFYGFSHLPHHKISLPKETFTITIIRNPIDRILSHYKMLIENFNKNIYNEEEKWLGNTFSEFLSNIPQRHLLRQLYMFSKNYNHEEAMENILNCSHFFFTDMFSEGLNELSQKIGIKLEHIHTRKSTAKIKLNTNELDQLNSKLEKEIKLYNELKKQ